MFMISTLHKQILILIVYIVHNPQGIVNIIPPGDFHCRLVDAQHVLFITPPAYRGAQKAGARHAFGEQQ